MTKELDQYDLEHGTIKSWEPCEDCKFWEDFVPTAAPDDLPTDRGPEGWCDRCTALANDREGETK